MNRSKKIEVLIEIVVLLKDWNAVWPVISLSDTEVELCEALGDHLSDYFWSCEGDSWEYALVSGNEFDCMGLDEMVEYYNEHKYGELRD